MAAQVDLELKKALIKNQACFAKLAPNENDVLATLFIEKYVPAGQTIVTEGDPVDSVFLIVSGTADVRHITIKNNAAQIQSLAKLGPEQAIGLNERGFYSLSGVRTATVVAETDMVLLQLSVAAFHGFALSYPHVSEIMRKNAEDYMSDQSES